MPKVLFADGDPEVNSVSNLAWACPRCNEYKSDKTEGADPLTDDIVSLFNPRLDNWPEHFLAHNSGHIVGLTPKGRATVEVLRFNDEARVINRIPLFLRGRWPGSRDF